MVVPEEEEQIGPRQQHEEGGRGEARHRPARRRLAKGAAMTPPELEEERRVCHRQNRYTPWIDPEQRHLHHPEGDPAPPGSPVEHRDHAAQEQRHAEDHERVASSLGGVAQVPGVDRQKDRGEARGPGQADAPQAPGERPDRRDPEGKGGEPHGTLGGEP
jgi:hypothetical protein